MVAETSHKIRFEMKYQYEVIESATVYDGFLKINRYRLSHDLYEGGVSQELIRERLERLRAASVLLYDPALDQVVLVEQFRVGALEQPDHPWVIETVGGQVVLVEQFRVGALEQPDHPWVIETVGGYIGEHETPEGVARREAVEEASCEIQALEPICNFMVSPGLSVDRIYLFCGQVDASNAGGVHGLDHEGEDIRVVVMDADQAIGELYAGRMNSTSVIIALQWLATKREELKQRWSVPV
jgi:ADP-ribose pyrophosphatase